MTRAARFSIYRKPAQNPRNFTLRRNESACAYLFPKNRNSIWLVNSCSGSINFNCPFFLKISRPSGVQLPGSRPKTYSCSPIIFHWVNESNCSLLYIILSPIPMFLLYISAAAFLFLRLHHNSNIVLKIFGAFDNQTVVNIL